MKNIKSMEEVAQIEFEERRRILRRRRLVGFAPLLFAIFVLIFVLFSSNEALPTVTQIWGAEAYEFYEHVAAIGTLLACADISEAVLSDGGKTLYFELCQYFSDFFIVVHNSYPLQPVVRLSSGDHLYFASDSTEPITAFSSEQWPLRRHYLHIEAFNAAGHEGSLNVRIYGFEIRRTFD